MNFSKILLHWYKYNKREFPWRNTKDAYTIWLSEIILQQTKTSQGLPYFNAFMDAYKNVTELANADEQDILHLWQGLGYYSRARNLHFAANQVVNDFKAVFPTNYHDLMTLKGIGDYTASAISSICIDEPNAVVDGNVYRVLSRVFGMDTPINSSKGIKDFKALAQELIPKKGIGDFNQAIMDFGAVICTPKKVACLTCIFNHKCLALATNKVDVLPVKIKKNKIKRRYFNYLVLLDGDNNTSLVQRTEKDIWQNLYQFPLIESESEIEETSMVNFTEFTNLVDSDFKISLFNEKPIRHILSHQHIFCKFWIVSVSQIKHYKIAIKEMEKYPVPTLISNFNKNFTTFDVQ